ncbi:MAG: acyloxyacyl hydrolase [Chlorobi bacterium]|nr:acyloxyacyl hydrolase [Chlorobiota bacterium]
MRKGIWWWMLWIAGSVASFAQPYFGQAGYIYGYSWPHHDHLTRNAGQQTDGFFVQVLRPPRFDRQGRWVYPESGFHAAYIDLKNEHTRYLVTLAYVLNFPLYKARHHRFYFTWGEGLARNGGYYDEEKNPANLVFGSRYLFYSFLGFNWRKLFDGGGALETGILMYHSSNALVNVPNNGLNIPSFQISWFPVYDKRHERQEVDARADTLRWHGRLFAYGAWNRPDLRRTPLGFFWNAGAEVSRLLNFHWRWVAGAEWMESQSLREWIRYRHIAFGLPLVPSSRAGVFTGPELVWTGMSLGWRTGWYVYNPSGAYAKWYWRMAVRFHIYKPLYAGLQLKGHFFVAEEMSFGLTYQLW